MKTREELTDLIATAEVNAIIAYTKAQEALKHLKGLKRELELTPKGLPNKYIVYYEKVCDIKANGDIVWK